MVSQQLLFEGLFFICTRVVSFAAQANDTTKAQINNIPEKSYVIIISINVQGQIISRMYFLKIQMNDKFKTTSNHHITVDSTSY